MADVDLGLVNMPKYATVINSGSAVLGTGSSTVGATALGVDGIAADAKAIYTAGAYGGIVDYIALSTDDTTAVNVRLYVLNSDSSIEVIGIVPVPIQSGDLGTALNVDAFASLNGCSLDEKYHKIIRLKAGAQLKIAVKAAMTANKKLFGMARGLDFIA